MWNLVLLKELHGVWSCFQGLTGGVCNETDGMGQFELKIVAIATDNATAEFNNPMRLSSM